MEADGYRIQRHASCVEFPDLNRKLSSQGHGLGLEAPGGQLVFSLEVKSLALKIKPHALILLALCALFFMLIGVVLSM